MDKPDGKGLRIVYIIMTLWSGIGIARWVAGGLPIHHGSAYAAGQNFGTLILFMMFGFGVYKLHQLRKAKKKTGQPQDHG